ncbi:hypothetical protein HZY97_20180 [Sphingomonas sp. R-74633]|uniref:hypothetical protein n=1 Tax=Sphingomonas sp. R-74633 TaxID=2751188 RepID=UPI0015D1D7FF|nr:hypothetical protein [Sphingomonas sp. R-74633]NYT43104.1 hypothetical protein [Sphingomonas sp. R-74633]
MALQTGAGATLALSAAAPATQDAAGYAALTFTEVGQIEKIGAIGATFAKTDFQPLKGPKQKLKGSPDYGSLQPSYAHDDSDAGQTLLRTAANDETNKLYSMKATYQDGSKRYAQVRVFSAPETIDGADPVVMVTPTIEICTKVIPVAAT